MIFKFWPALMRRCDREDGGTQAASHESPSSARKATASTRTSTPPRSSTAPRTSSTAQPDETLSSEFISSAASLISSSVAVNHTSSTSLLGHSVTLSNSEARSSSPAPVSLRTQSPPATSPLTTSHRRWLIICLATILPSVLLVIGLFLCRRRRGPRSVSHVEPFPYQDFTGTASVMSSSQCQVPGTPSANHHMTAVPNSPPPSAVPSIYTRPLSAPPGALLSPARTPPAPASIRRTIAYTPHYASVPPPTILRHSLGTTGPLSSYDGVYLPSYHTQEAL